MAGSRLDVVKLAVARLRNDADGEARAFLAMYDAVKVWEAAQPPSNLTAQGIHIAEQPDDENLPKGDK